MRALARDGRMKLGALQDHIPPWEDLLRDLAAFIAEECGNSFDALAAPELLFVEVARD